jgi:hypothetical protein
VSRDGKSPPAQRAARTELACARALLDALEAMLDAENEERAQCGVALQMAEQFIRLANALSHWEATWSQNGVLDSCHDDSFKFAPPSRITEGARVHKLDAKLGPEGGTDESADERAQGAPVILTSLAS